MTNAKATIQLSKINRINLMYGSIGLALMSQFGGAGSWRSFVAGWLIAVLNFELIKHLGRMLLGLYDGSKIGPLFYYVLFGKFIFWGMVIALFSKATWMQGIPFALGMTTLVVSGLGLGFTEKNYAQ